MKEEAGAALACFQPVVSWRPLNSSEATAAVEQHLKNLFTFIIKLAAGRDSCGILGILGAFAAVAL